MTRYPLGTSGLEITRIGLGSWAIGGWMWGGQDDQQSVEAIHAAIDHGINWIDTAPIYGSGHSERVVGRAIQQLPASKRPLVFTKYGEGDDSSIRRRSASRSDVLAECDASLKRLGVDCIDLFQIHWPAPQDIAETAGACETLLTAGKIRAIGVCNYSVAQLDEWLATGVPLHSLQAPYNLLRPAVGSAQLPWCAKHNVGAIVYSPLFRGLLFGTWPRDKQFPPGDARGEHKDYQGARFQRNLDAVDELRALAAENGMSCAQLCVGVLFRTPGLTGCIVGARNASQGASIAELAVDVPDGVAAAVDDITARLRRDVDAIPA
ncbi:MAG: aldo/keto reductase [Acidobacteria bacterium]|nr:aldo/keto reductase [Acidobacteriota bacterium]